MLGILSAFCLGEEVYKTHLLLDNLPAAWLLTCRLQSSGGCVGGLKYAHSTTLHETLQLSFWFPLSISVSLLLFETIIHSGWEKQVS